MGQFRISIALFLVSSAMLQLLNPADFGESIETAIKT